MCFDQQQDGKSKERKTTSIPIGSLKIGLNNNQFRVFVMNPSMKSSHQQVLNIPLRCALVSADPSFVMPTIPFKWLVSDLLHLSSRNSNSLSLYTKKDSKWPLLLQTITDALWTVTSALLPASWGPSPVSYATIWLSKFTVWIVPSGRQKKVPVSLVLLGLLRRSLQSSPSLLPWPHPPIVHICSYLPYLCAVHWKKIWF
ncbi:hypothetical protein INT46_007719 [Mucor plumbeus]|uniref:Uncharacterized protein n=1 Tax=Mucor plumbeus TaxID=97098 RepID=A0A8H7QUJ7_9FUNG|nr:hypothetical protein INT46_007719 [Mucor plumbeus]